MAFIPACWDCESLDTAAADPTLQTMEAIATARMVQSQTEWYYQDIPPFFKKCIFITYYKLGLLQSRSKGLVSGDT